MKKRLFAFIAIAFLISGGVAYSYEEGSSANAKEDHPGSAADPVRVYTLVRYPDANPNTTSLSSGDVVIWDLASDDGVSVNLNSVVGLAGAVLSNDAVAGVAVDTIPTSEPNTGGNTAVQDIGKRNWGYIQIYGFNSACKVDSSAILAGSGLRASADPRRAAIGSISLGSIGGGPLGFAYDANSSATSDAAEVFIRVR